MDNQDILNIALRFQREVDDHDNSTKPNSTDLRFATASMTAHRHRATDNPEFTDVDERLAIIDSIDKYILDQSFQETDGEEIRDLWAQIKTPTFWAMLWVLPIPDLHKLVSAMREANLGTVIARYFLEMKKIIDLFDIFFGKSRSAGRVAPTRRARDANIPTLAKERDHRQCIVTSVVHPHACHIFPFSSLNNPRTPTVVEALFRIWTRPEALKEKLGTGSKSLVDTVQNIVCLSRDLHDMWGRAYLAFYPETAQQNEDGSWSMKLQFHWMRMLDLHYGDIMGDNFLKTPLEFTEQHHDGQIGAVHLQKKTPIDDGKIIVIQAKTKEELPDYDILRLQWDIIKMASLCGGAERDEEEEHNNDVSDADEMYSSAGRTWERYP